MKGQFLVISSVVIGLMIITTASTLAEVQSREIRSEPASYYVHILKDEAQKVDKTDPEERRNFRKMVDMVSRYSSETSYWRAENCFNITLTRPGTSLRFHTPGCPA